MKRKASKVVGLNKLGHFYLIFKSNMIHFGLLKAMYSKNALTYLCSQTILSPNWLPMKESYVIKTKLTLN